MVFNCRPDFAASYAGITALVSAETRVTLDAVGSIWLKAQGGWSLQIWAKNIKVTYGKGTELCKEWFVVFSLSLNNPGKLGFQLHGLFSLDSEQLQRSESWDAASQACRNLTSWEVSGGTWRLELSILISSLCCSHAASLGKLSNGSEFGGGSMM